MHKSQPYLSTDQGFTRRLPRQTQLWVVALFLLALVWRLPGLFAHTFHADEALFASWARLIAVWRDPLLQTQLIDEPPLAFYLQAAFYPLLGNVPYAARLPNFIASLLLLPVLAQWLWHLYQDELTVRVAAIVLVFSPLAIQSSATAFLDPLLVTLLLAALWAQAAGGRGRPFTAGFLYGLALLTKIPAVLYFPLLLGQGWLFGWRWRQWRRWLAGLLPLALLFLAWHVAYDGPPVWQLQFARYGGLRLIWSWELWPRLSAWGPLWGATVGTPSFFLALLLPVFLAWLVQQEDWHTALDQLFVIAFIAYFLLLWFVAGHVTDRYVLPVLPLVALIVARLTARIWSALPLVIPPPRLKRLLPLLLVGLCLAQMPAALAARQSRYPIGGSPAADAGAAQVAAYLADAPYGTVLYDHWYSWQWRYHFFDTGVYVSWFPHPTALVADLQAFARVSAGSRYLALPPDAAAAPVQRAVQAAGFRLEPVLQTTLPDGRPGITLFHVAAP